MKNVENNKAPILFRWHRQLLEDSMATVQSVSDYNDLKDIIAKEYGLGSKDTIAVSFYARDDRIKWDCYIVTVNGNAIGFTNQAVDIPAIAS